MRPFQGVEIILGSFVFISVDGIAFLIDLTGVGTLIAPILQSCATFSMDLWLRSKGDKNTFKIGRQIVKHGANLLPVLPTNTTVFVVAVILHNRQSKKETAAGEGEA